MTKIKKIFKYTTYSLIAFVFTFSFVFAQNPGKTPSSGNVGAGTIKNPIKATDIQEFLLQILDIIIQVGVVFVVLFLLLAGLKFVTARGNEQKILEAKKTIFATLIGALLVLGARAIAEVVQRTARELQSMYEIGVPVFGIIRNTKIKDYFKKK